MSKFKLRVRYRVNGDHVHMRVFSGKNFPGATLGKAGDLTLTTDEFQEWIDGVATIEFEPEEDRKGNK